MNQNTEYELFTREIYQILVNADVVKTTYVRHNVKLEGRSGQMHQIDVYWEYEVAGNKHKVAIECKNYNSRVPISVVQSFKGVLDDLNNVNGIIVSKKGFQVGAKRVAKEWGISLQELRKPDYGESILGEIEFDTHIETRLTLYKIDEEWASSNGIDLPKYRHHLDLIHLGNTRKWTLATYIPLYTTNNYIQNRYGEIINSLEKMNSEIPDHPTDEFPFTFYFEDGYVNTRDLGRIKIQEVRFEYEIHDQQQIITIDAEGFVRAILKDALTGEKKFL